MAHIIAVAHYAGGVGKTTTTLNLGYQLAQRKQRVLLVDLDPQADLSGRIGLGAASAQLAALLLGEPDVTLQPQTVSWAGVQLDGLAASPQLADLDMRLGGQTARERTLQRALQRLSTAYDFILLDTPPTLSLLTVNSFFAADTILIPLQTQDKAYRALAVILRTIEELGLARSRRLLIAATMTDHSSMCAEVIAATRQRYGSLLLEALIPQRVKTRDEARYQAPISCFAPRDSTSLGYAAMAREIVERIESGGRENVQTARY